MKMIKSPKIAYVVLNWNSWYDTIECLESLLRLAYDSCHIIVIDNGSTNDSLIRIKNWANGKEVIKSKYFDSNQNTKPIAFVEYSTIACDAKYHHSDDAYLTLINNGRNDGFSAGYNVGIRYALTIPDIEYIMVVNNDTVVAQDINVRLLDIMAKDESCGMAGGKILYYHDSRIIWYGGGKISWVRGGGIYVDRDKTNSSVEVKPQKVSFISGCFLFIRVKALEQVGLLPEEYFMGGEEYEYSVRMTRAGFTLWYDPNCIIWHKVGRSHDIDAGGTMSLTRFSTDSSNYIYKSPKYIYNWYRYKLLFQRRNLFYPFYVTWIAFFLLYIMSVQLFGLKKIKHVQTRIFKMVVYRAILDHLKYNSITLEHLIDIEKRAAVW